MILFKKEINLRKWLDAQQKNDHKVGFVPTMGALHAGHISLVELSKKENPVTVCSIFVNPAQFNDAQDFEKYPHSIEKDIYLLEQSGCDVLFLPSVKEMYPNGFTAKVHYELGYLETVLEGKYRPGHFQGVCMVVQRLLEIVKPGRLYLGQKDYQQCLVITKLIELIGLKELVNIIICPTLRESDGLAMSSRNLRLKEEDRKAATAIYRSLCLIKASGQNENMAFVKQKARTILEEAGLRIDYIEIADAKDLALLNEWDGKPELIALVAAYMKEVRLIDNMLI